MKAMQTAAPTAASCFSFCSVVSDILAPFDTHAGQPEHDDLAAAGGHNDEHWHSVLRLRNGIRSHRFLCGRLLLRPLLPRQLPQGEKLLCLCLPYTGRTAFCRRAEKLRIFASPCDVFSFGNHMAGLILVEYWLSAFLHAARKCRLHAMCFVVAVTGSSSN